MVWAVCTCGYGDGRFTLVTIVPDGNLADWAPVHADIDNNVCDGPVNSLVDRDAPVQSTGRDLTHFAFTWDLNNIYLFTERFGSASNIQSFVYYADINNNGLMETGEPVIGVAWRGSNRRVDVYTFTYVADAPGGDPMIDDDGFGDGYTLPGSFAGVPPSGNPNRTGVWGSADGLQMEFFVTWAEIGVTPGSPFTFHVSSSNASLRANSFTAQIDDNLSGCGGRLGSTVVSDLDFFPDLVFGGIGGQTTVAAHTLINTGNDADFFDLSSVTSGDFVPSAIRYYHDVDSDGLITAADILLTDTDGDADPDTGVIAAGASINILIAYDVPLTINNGDSATVTTTAASDYQPLAIDAIADTLNVVLPPDIVITKAVEPIDDPVNGPADPRAIPGSVIAYTISVSNQGAGSADADTTIISDAIPPQLCFRVVDIGAAGSGPLEFTDGPSVSGLSYTFIGLADVTDDIDFSNDGGAMYTYLPSDNGSGCDPAVTNIRVKLKGTFAADTGSGAPGFDLTFNALVD